MSTPTNPGWPTGYIPTAEEWEAAFSGKVDFPAPPSQGGTGNTSLPANGQLLIGNGNGYSLNTLTAGSNITIDNSAGTITISSSGGGGTNPSSAGITYWNGTAWSTSYNTSGTGTVVALTVSPSFTSPSIGAASGTSLALISNGQSTTIAGSATASASVSYKLPPAGPSTNGYLLASTTAGVMSWVAPQSGPTGPTGPT